MQGERKSVVVTGAGAGIGRATVERLARGGWNVLAVDLDADRLGWIDGSDPVVPFIADVTSEAANLEIAQEAQRSFGGLDAAIFNAGISVSGAVDVISFETFQKVVAVNLYGPLLGVRSVLPALRRRGGGAIVVTSSTMGVGGEAESSAYAASKHAVIGLVKSLSRELGCEGIRINALCPGPTRGTGMTQLVETAAPAHFEMMRQGVPLQRWAEPDEMASVMEFLISPASSYVNGLSMIADGGAFGGIGLMPPKTPLQSAIPDVIAADSQR